VWFHNRNERDPVDRTLRTTLCCCWHSSVNARPNRLVVGCGRCRLRWCTWLCNYPLVLLYILPLYPEVHGGEPEFGITKLGAAGVCPCPKVLAIVCCVIPQIGVEPSMMV
jgi:hypothetical protein